MKKPGRIFLLMSALMVASSAQAGGYLKKVKETAKSVEKGVRNEVEKVVDGVVQVVTDPLEIVQKAAEEVKKVVTETKGRIETTKKKLESIKRDISSMPQVFKPEIIQMNIGKIKLNPNSLGQLPQVNFGDVAAGANLSLSSGGRRIKSLFDEAVGGAKHAGGVVSHGWKHSGSLIARGGKKFWRDVVNCLNANLLFLCHPPEDQTCDQLIEDDDADYEDRIECFEKRSSELERYKASLIARRSNAVRNLKNKTKEKIEMVNLEIKKLGEVGDE